MLVSVTLIVQAIAHLTAADFNLLNVSVAAFALLLAGCLLVGFFTPLVAILILLATIGLAFAAVPLSLQYPSDTLHVIVLSAAILLLGPGAFSVDARMFGRREIRIPAVANRVEGM